MTLRNLENLVRSGQLKSEPPDQNEFNSMVTSAGRRLQDSMIEGLSEDSQFSLAYGAAYGLALAAMRWHGYRTDKRYLVFQCLQHTVGLETAKWRVLDKCHKQRNLAEYEGQLEVTPQLIQELAAVTCEMLELVKALGPVNTGSNS